jgi:hypothetical protein
MAASVSAVAAKSVYLDNSPPSSLEREARLPGTAAIPGRGTVRFSRTISKSGCKAKNFHCAETVSRRNSCSRSSGARHEPRDSGARDFAIRESESDRIRMRG